MKLLNKFEEKINHSSYDYTKHSKYFMFIPLVLILVGFIVFSFVGLNLGYDFSNTYQVTTKISASLDTNAQNQQIDDMYNIIEKNGIKKYNVIESRDARYITLTVEYKALKDASSTKMVELGTTIKTEIAQKLNLIVDYDVISSDVISPSIDNNLIKNFAMSFGIGLLIVAVYLFIRFDAFSAINIILSFILDMLTLFSVYSICRIPVETSILAVFALVGLISFVKNIILYARLREDINTNKNEKILNSELISNCIKENMPRMVYTTILLEIILFLIVVVSISAVKFAILPIMIWLLLTFVLSNFVMSNLWTKMYNRKKDYFLKHAIAKNAKKKEKQDKMVI